jgi:DNA polymerase-1
MIYLDLASLGPTEELAILRCKQLELAGAVVPSSWRYQVLLHAGGDDTIICGPLGLNFWRLLPATCKLVSVAALEDSDPLPNRANSPLEWALIQQGLVASEAAALVAKAPTPRSSKYQKYVTASSLAYVIGSGKFTCSLPEFEVLSNFTQDTEQIVAPYTWHLVDDTNIEAAITNLNWAVSVGRRVGVDVETDVVGIHPNEMQDILVGIGVAFSDDNSCYYGSIDNARWIAALKNYLPKLSLVGHNAKYELCMLRRYGVDLETMAGDSMLAAYLHGVPEAGLKKLVYDRYKVRMTTYDDVVGKGTKRKKISEIDPEIVAAYCCSDSYWTLRMEGDLVGALDDAKKELYKSDMSLIPVIAAMQFDGVNIDREGATTKLLALEDQQRSLASMIDSVVTTSGFATPIVVTTCKQCRNGSRKKVGCMGCRGVGSFSSKQPFNPGSSDQIVAWLHGHLILPIQGRTKRGDASVDALSLLRLRPLHVGAQLLLMFKQCAKYIGFLTSWLAWSEADSKLHPVFTMARTRSGRHSSQDPNVQQVKGEWREFFIAPKGREFISADYGQIEVRVAAHVSRDAGLVAAMTAEVGTRDADLHAQNVERIFGVSYEDQQLPGFDNSMRVRAKNYLFGALYGSKGQEVQAVIEKALLEDDTLTVPIPTVKEIAAGIRTIQDTYPTYFHEWRPMAIYKCKESGGRVSTLYGHVRDLPDILSSNKYLEAAAERACISHIVQGSAGDLLRFAELRVAEYVNGLEDITLHLTNHDELVISALNAASHVGAIRSIMELGQPLLPIPLVVDIKIGTTWKVK